jgi:hypothetical protein
MHSKNIEDPYCFRRKPAYFNTTGLMYGRRLRNCQIYPGMIRFNRTSGFDPEFVDRISGKTFEAAPPRLLRRQGPAPHRIPWGRSGPGCVSRNLAPRHARRDRIPKELEISGASADCSQQTAGPVRGHAADANGTLGADEQGTLADFAGDRKP